MTANVPMVTPLQKRNWIDNMQKQMIMLSVFEPLSSRAIPTAVVGNEKEIVPDAVVQYVSDKFTKGVMFTTIPSMDKLKKKGVGGFQPAEGSEETPSLRYARVFYNVKRKAVTFADGSVEGDATEAYDIIGQKTSLMGDYFAELNDYDKQRALIMGGDEFLTEAEYWTGSALGGFNGAPVAKKLHPNNLIIGQSGFSSVSTWNATWETHVTSLVTACNQTGVAARRFTKARLDAIVRYAALKVQPLNWKSGGMTITHVIKLSQESANQLMSDTTTSGAGNWWATMTGAGERGVSNRAISGVLGIYQGCVLIIDPRAPLFNCVSDVTISATLSAADIATARFQFVKPWSDGGSTAIDAGDNRVPAAKVDGTAGATSGTMEVNMILGRGAIGVAEVRKLAFHSDKKDYDFREGFEARMSNGNMRMDFTAENLAANSWGSLTAQTQNWTSAMFLVPTTALSL